MITFTAKEISNIISGQLIANPNIKIYSGVHINSKFVKKGSLFIAKSGNIRDGHDFIDDALKLGASLVIAEKKITINGHIAPSIIVDDVVLAIGKLASEVLRRIKNNNNLKIIGITGSVGKTTTKDLLYSIFSKCGNTVAPINSYNGPIGVPLTVFRCNENTKYLIVEMGADSIGDIRYLCDMVSPDIGIVLCVGTAHSGTFGGIDKIAVAKQEMVENLNENSFAILNQNDKKVVNMKCYTKAKIIWFNHNNHNYSQKNTIKAINIKTNKFSNPEFDLVFPDNSIVRIFSKLIGDHNINNMLAAAGAAFTVKVPIKIIANSLSEECLISKWRLQRNEHKGGFTIINDAYNASPESVISALKVLKDLGGKFFRTWAILGEMLDLGNESKMHHYNIGCSVAKLRISKLLVVGENAKEIFDAACIKGSSRSDMYFVKTLEEAKNLLFKKLLPNDIVLFKSSNNSKLGILGDEILHSSVNNFKNMT